MDVSNLNLSNQKLQEDNFLSNSRAFLRPGKATLIPYAHRVGKSIPNWDKTLVSHLAAPRLGTEFLESELTIMPEGGSVGALNNGYENFFFVTEGVIEAKVAGESCQLAKEGFFFAPPGAEFEVMNKTQEKARILWVRKVYESIEGYKAPWPVIGKVADLEGFQSPADYEQHCLPFEGDFSWDMAMNICTYYPGVTMPRTETHICEHGNYVISGRGLIWINGTYTAVYPDDFWFVAPYTPHTALGLAPTALRYLLYKNINREFNL